MATKYWLRSKSTNLQAPNPKQYPNSNFECPKRICFGIWSFGDWKLLGVWDLEFGDWDFNACMIPATPR